MTNETVAALYSRLATDATLTTSLPLYRGARTIFSEPPAPVGAPLPYIVIFAPRSAAGFDTKDLKGRDLMIDIGFYDKAAGDARLVNALAERGWTLLHRFPLSVSGWATLLTRAAGPIEAPTDETVYGRLVSYRIVLRQIAA